MYSRLLSGLPDAQSVEVGKYVVARSIRIARNDRQLTAFIRDVTAALLGGRRHRTPGFGTFSTCTRKATASRGPSKMAIFRASVELREYSSGGPRPTASGPHARVIRAIVEAMQSDQGVELPRLGRMAVVPVPGRRPKLIFHGAKEINGRLADTRPMDASRSI